MIVPGCASPLRPVLHAFYAAGHALGYGATPEAYLKALRQYLEAHEHRVRAAAIPRLDLVVNDRVGVAVLPLTGLLTPVTRQRFRRLLMLEASPVVVVLMAFVPEPRLARVDAPLSRQRQVLGAPKAVPGGQA